MKKRDDRLEVTYEIEDGYSGGARPQHVVINHSEIQECETLDEAVQLVEDFIRDDFANKAYPAYDQEAITRDVEAIWKKRPAETD